MGWLDSVGSDGVAYGWACDPNNFAVPLAVHFYVDGPAGAGGTFIGSATASVWREVGVASACGGNPFHGFAFTLPASVRTGTARTLYAYAINIGPAASNPLLNGSPKWFTLQSPPNLNAELRLDAFSSSSSETYYWGGVRCKKYAFTEHYSQTGLYRVMRYEGGFGVCYRLNAGIVSVSYRVGDAYWTCCGWEWRGNETGYPYHIRESKKVTFHYRGKMALCILSVGCGQQRHPWMTYTFYDSNTISRTGGVG